MISLHDQSNFKVLTVMEERRMDFYISEPSILLIVGRIMVTSSFRTCNSCELGFYLLLVTYIALQHFVVVFFVCFVLLYYP